MSDAGVPLIAGTDARSIPGLVPGFSLHDDLRALTKAGLSNYQALSSATRMPGRFIEATIAGSESFGTVARGSRADVIMTSRNPLEDLATLRSPLGVMAAGHWYSATELHQLLDSVSSEYERALASPRARSRRMDEVRASRSH